MTELAQFEHMIANIFQVLGRPGWLTKPHQTTSLEVRAIVSTPDRDDLVGQGPISLTMRYLDLPATSNAATGDLVTVGDTSFVLARSANPDELGLANRWIGVPFTVPVYHADGYPLVGWNGYEWATIS